MKYKNDIVLIGILLVLCAASLAATFFGKRAGADLLQIYGGGRLIASLPVQQKIFLLLTAEDGAYELKQFSSREEAYPAKEAAEHYNFIAVDHGKAWVCEADCKGKDCVRQKEITGDKESIICLPNKMLICLRRSGKEEGAPDAVTW